MSDTMKPYDELRNRIGGRIFKNSKTGKLYQTICIAREVTNCLRPRDVVVYCSMDNPSEIFTRQYNEFFEYIEVGNQYVRRFVEVFAPTKASDTKVNNKECDKLKKNTDDTTQQKYYTCVIRLDKPMRNVIYPPDVLKKCTGCVTCFGDCKCGNDNGTIIVPKDCSKPHDGTTSI